MSDKQVIVSLSSKELEKIKEGCARKKRSLSGQLRRLLEDIPADKEVLRQFGESGGKKIEMQPQGSAASPGRRRNGQANTVEPVRVAIKVPTEEFWEAKEKAAASRLTLKEFCKTVLLRWIEGDLREHEVHGNSSQLSASPGSNARAAGSH